MNDLFAPNDEWKAVYDYLRNLRPGDVVTYEKYEELLGRDLRDNRYPHNRAVKELEEVDKRTMEAVRSLGYRVIEAGEHVRLARTHERRGHRQIRKGIRKVVCADPALMTDEQRRINIETQIRLSRLEESHRALSRRVRQVESAQETVAVEVSAKLAALEAKLAERGLL